MVWYSYLGCLCPFGFAFYATRGKGYIKFFALSLSAQSSMKKVLRKFCMNDFDKTKGIFCYNSSIKIWIFFPPSYLKFYRGGLERFV